MTKLDFEIAEKIMGWVRTPDHHSGDGQGWYWVAPERGVVQGSMTPKYSTEISDAWEVVEAVSKLPEGSVRQRFVDCLLGSGLLVSRDIAARNICLAALSAMADLQKDVPS